MKTVTVRFHHRLYDTAHYGRPDADKKEYDYLYDGDKPVESGGYAVVKAPTSGLTCVTIVRVAEGAGPKATKCLVDVVDMTGYEEREVRRKEAAAIQAELGKLYKEQNELDRWAALAASNPRAAELLEKLKSL